MTKIDKRGGERIVAACVSQTAGRGWVRSLSGARINILHPSPLDYCNAEKDMILGLAREPRWSGQTIGENRYCVGQHSFHVMELAARDPRIPPSQRPAVALAAILHDATEWVVKDLASPFKQAMRVAIEAHLPTSAAGIDVYHEIEERHAQAIHMAYGLPGVLRRTWREVIHHADRQLAAIEAYQLARWSFAEIRDDMGFRGTEKDLLPAQGGRGRAPLALSVWDELTTVEKFTQALGDARLAFADSGYRS